MRERTTWNRDEVMKRVAALNKTADPYLMNQDHVKQQPSAEKYMNGDPSSWAEDVSPKDWDSETKRNEVGMADMHPETFSHKEKTAASEEVLLKKANLCVKIARAILPKNAAEGLVEDQALAFMHLPNSELIATHARLAKEADENDRAMNNWPPTGKTQPVHTVGKEANEQEQGQKDQGQKDQGQAQEKQANQGQEQGQKEQSEQAQAKQAGELPPALKEHMEEKKEEAAKEEQGQKEAAAKAAQQDEQKGQQEQAQAKQANGVFSMEQMQAQLQQQVAQMVQQAMQQMMQQQAGQQQQQAPAAPVANGDAIDQMLAEQQQMPAMAHCEGDIEMDAPVMDMGDSVLASDDDVLRSLFANDESEAQEQQSQEHGQQKQAFVRTASTRTVGTKPAGVSRIGGSAAKPSSDADRLSGLWNSAPDVSEVFGCKR